VRESSLASSVVVVVVVVSFDDADGRVVIPTNRRRLPAPRACTRARVKRVETVVIVAAIVHFFAPSPTRARSLRRRRAGEWRATVGASTSTTSVGYF